MNFKLMSDYEPRGDQPEAIEQLSRGLEAGEKHQVLLGVTRSGKTFTVAKMIERANRPVRVLAHNMTLAAQLYSEFKSFFPQNAVEYFASYYDYYQPEAYIQSALAICRLAAEAALLADDENTAGWTAGHAAMLVPGGTTEIHVILPFAGKPRLC